jgi:hypothetical protein
LQSFKIDLKDIFLSAFSNIGQVEIIFKRFMNYLNLPQFLTIDWNNTFRHFYQRFPVCSSVAQVLQLVATGLTFHWSGRLHKIYRYILLAGDSLKFAHGAMVMFAR